MSFRKRVYDTVKNIPMGNVSSYSSVASRAGRPGTARAVGMLMSRNPCPGTGPGRVPCHRVIRKDGSLGGFTSPKGAGEKIRLLEREGIKLEKGRVPQERFL